MKDRIISIERLNSHDTIDIELDGNHLFYANGILTHNSNSDVGLEDTSESFGLPMTADFMIAAISSEELEDMNQIMIKQLKNRYNDPASNRRFVLGIDKSRMRIYDIEQADTNTNIDNRTPVASGKFDKDVFNDWR